MGRTRICRLVSKTGSEGPGLLISVKKPHGRLQLSCSFLSAWQEGSIVVIYIYICIYAQKALS